MSDTVRFNTAAFFYQYEDFQVNVDDPVSPIVPITRNIDEAEAFGIEAELTWIASDNLEVKLGYAYLGSELTETNRMLTGLGPAPFPLIGNTPVNSAENQFNGSFKYLGSLTAGWSWSFYLDFRWVDKRFLEPSNQPADT